MWNTIKIFNQSKMELKITFIESLDETVFSNTKFDWSLFNTIPLAASVMLLSQRWR